MSVNNEDDDDEDDKNKITKTSTKIKTKYEKKNETENNTGPMELINSLMGNSFYILSLFLNYDFMVSWNTIWMFP